MAWDFRQLRISEQQGRDLGGGLLLEVWHRVAVDIERERNSRVAEAFGNDLRMDASLKR